MATFEGDDVRVDDGTYAWVYQNQTLDKKLCGPMDLAPEPVENNGQLFPTYPQFNPRLVRLDSGEEYVGDTVLTWKNIVVYQTKQRRTQIRASEETLRRRIIEYKCKNMWHLDENTVPNVPNVPSSFHAMLRGELDNAREKAIVRMLSPGFDRASGEDCVRATKYAKCGCNQDGEPLTLKIGERTSEEEFSEPEDNLIDPETFLQDLQDEVDKLNSGSEDNLIQAAKNRVVSAFKEIPDSVIELDELLRRINEIETKKVNSGSGETKQPQVPPLPTSDEDEPAAGDITNVFGYERPPNDAALDALTGLMDNMNMVDETSDEEETFDEPATHVPNVALLGETSDEEETFDEPAAQLSESSMPSAIYATTSDDDFSAPAGHLSEAESEQSERSMLYATTSDDEFSAPAGQLSDVSSEVSSEAGDIPSAAFTSSSAPSNMYASTSETEDDVSTAELGWTASTPASNSMYVSSSDAGDDLMSLTKDM